MWNWLEKYFTFTRGERNGIIILIFLSFLVLLAPKVYFYFKPVQHVDNSKYEKEIEAFAQQKNIDLSTEPETTADSISKATSPTKVSRPLKSIPSGERYFEFDPNKIGVEQWRQLGFSEKDANMIEHYKAKGGKFYRVQDLLRLYCMTEDHYNKLKPYVKIDVSALPQRK